MPVFMIALLALVTFLVMFVLCVAAVLAESRQRRRMVKGEPFPAEAGKPAAGESVSAEEKPKTRAAHA